MRKSPDQPWKAVALVSAIGIDLAVCVLAGFFGGKFLYDRFGGALWIAFGVLVGLAAGFINIIYLIKQFTGDQNG